MRHNRTNWWTVATIIFTGALWAGMVGHLFWGRFVYGGLIATLTIGFLVAVASFLAPLDDWEDPPLTEEEFTAMEEIQTLKWEGNKLVEDD